MILFYFKVRVKLYFVSISRLNFLPLPFSVRSQRFSRDPLQLDKEESHFLESGFRLSQEETREKLFPLLILNFTRHSV